MRWQDIKRGAEVYHRLFVTWGKGVVERVEPTSGLEAMFEKGRYRAVIRFEAHDEPVRLDANALLKRPNKKRIAEMLEFYKGRGVEAKDGGHRLILPEQPTTSDRDAPNS